MYNVCSQVSWADVIDKLNHEVHNNTARVMGTTYVLHNNYRPNTLQKAYEEVTLGNANMHVFLSFTSDSPTYGKHKDPDDVLLVQAIGEMKYFIQDQWIKIVPGQHIYIPMGVYHTPVVLTPRVTLSFSSYEYEIGTSVHPARDA
tara:strand:+ start:576 stop:1010 length:435 start_codon:yes stop_codon:yes gene_type:complete